MSARVGRGAVCSSVTAKAGANRQLAAFVPRPCIVPNGITCRYQVRDVAHQTTPALDEEGDDDPAHSGQENIVVPLKVFESKTTLILQ